MSTAIIAQETNTNPHETTGLERAVLYARVSSDDRVREGRNLSGQLEMGREYATNKQYHIVAEFAEDDRGASGYDIDLPKLNKIREMAHQGKFDVLIVRELDRLSRNLAKQLIIEEELRRYGVRIEYILAEYDDTPEGRLQKHIRATVAEYEREKIKERMMRGKRRKVQAGHVIVNNRPPYGYKKIKKENYTTLEALEDEAKVVRSIFTWYTTGDESRNPLSVFKITRKLTQMKVPTRGDKDKKVAKKRKQGQWGMSTVNRILNNETYAGIWHFGKYDARQHRNPDDRLIAVEVPAIISREVFEAAQARMESNKMNSKRSQKHNYLLNRRTICMKCGYKMNAICPNKSKGYIYYRCPSGSHPNLKQRCGQPYFKVADVDENVWQWVKKIITDPVTLEKGLTDHQADQEKVNEPLRQRLEVVENLIKKAENELAELLTSLKAMEKHKAKRSKAAILNEIEQTESLLDNLENQREVLGEQIGTNSFSERDITSIKEYAAAIAEDLDTLQTDFESRKRLMELLDVQVTLGVEDGQKIAYVRCHLGNQNLSIASFTTCHKGDIIS